MPLSACACVSTPFCLYISSICLEVFTPIYVRKSISFCAHSFQYGSNIFYGFNNRAMKNLGQYYIYFWISFSSIDAWVSWVKSHIIGKYRLVKHVAFCLLIERGNYDVTWQCFFFHLFLILNGGGEWSYILSVEGCAAPRLFLEFFWKTWQATGNSFFFFYRAAPTGTPSTLTVHTTGSQSLKVSWKVSKSRINTSSVNGRGTSKFSWSLVMQLG